MRYIFTIAVYDKDAVYFIIIVVCTCKFLS